MKKLNSLIIAVIILLSGVTVYAQPADSSTHVSPELKFVTKHSVTIGGKVINYTVTVGALLLKNEKDDTVALFGYTAYVKDGEDPAKRPVTFSYNGGPGSSSMWLHMGIMGPKRVVLNDPGNVGPPPYKTEDNPNSILDVSDVVMIDPVGTGLSHAVGKSKNKDFWGVDPDITSISQFIKQYITDNDRWISPKYLLGESYGTFRSAGIADNLQENLGITLNGIVLVSVVLDIRTLTFQEGDDISYVLHLPTYAAVAWFHNKILNKPANLDSFINEVRSYAGGEYSSALIKGDAISDGEKDSVATQLAYFTGLSKAYILKANLRVMEPQFTQELLRDDHLSVGRLDSRYKAINQDLLSEYTYFDPQQSAISSAFTATFMNYYYGDLKVSKAYTYHTDAYSSEGFDWDWKHAKNRNDGDPLTPNTGVDLAEAMSHNPNLKVLILNGYYDLATPFYATEYTINHLGLEKDIRKNITFKYYPAGHMMYIQPASANAFKKDVAGFITDTHK